VLPEHFKVAWGCLDNLTTHGREWILEESALLASRELQELQELQKIPSGARIVGYLSPQHAVNLPDAARERAGIPASARHFMFSYPVEVQSGDSTLGAIEASSSSNPDLAFLSYGGFIYLDDSLTRIVHINAVLPSNKGGLSFGPPLKWEGKWTNRLVRAGRFRPVTVEAICAGGATHFCWIRPNEVMWFGSTGGAPICPFGGFAYIRQTANETVVRSSLKRDASDLDDAEPLPQRRRDGSPCRDAI